MSPPVNSIRLLIPYFTYIQNPKRAILQLIGNNVNLISFSSNDIITDDDRIIVDVKYTSIQLSTLRIYYIKYEDLKRLLPNSDIYITEIEGCGVKIKMSKEPSKIVPIRVSPRIANNFSSSGQLEKQFLYYGTIVKSPLNSLYTPLKYMEHAYEPFETEEIEKQCPDDFRSKIEKEIEQKDPSASVSIYQEASEAIVSLCLLDSFTFAKSLSECKDGTVGYVIDFRTILSEAKHQLNGIILIDSKRINPYHVLYRPNQSFVISMSEIKSLAKFLDEDAKNYYNFRYIMGQ